MGVEAFRELPDRLVIVGRGPLEAELRRAAPDNVRLLTGVGDAELRWVYAHSAALIAPSIEDFGLTPIEGAAFGKPTLALRAGGYLDTVVEGSTGQFFERPAIHDIRRAVEANRPRQWDADAIRAHADSFSEERFHDRLRAEVESLLSRP
jgi:glycosyltransferase involved in cell wall biosynthesis